ncbi:MAG: hypothetical protein M3319_05955, partial [Actinomycetota bacterium]|nr:hypothetical protein [Actinomycetota bacterium]
IQTPLFVGPILKDIPFCHVNPLCADVILSTLLEVTVTRVHQGVQSVTVITCRISCSIFTLGEDGFVGEELPYTDAAIVLRQLGVLLDSAGA